MAAEATCDRDRAVERPVKGDSSMTRISVFTLAFIVALGELQ
jgi:hypothetical protein